MVHWIVILIYLSFILDFLIWPLPSEASTKSLLNKPRLALRKKSLFIGIFVFSLIFYLAPLIIALYSIVKNTNSYPLDYIGVFISMAGRIITLSGARAIISGQPGRLITNSLFRWTRNPIALGLHITVLGMLLVFPYWPLWLGFLFYLLNIHYKIVLEERHLKDKYGSVYSEYKRSTPRYLLL